MKCLSVKQPWAWLLATGVKDVENRTWSTRYRGPLLIHASLTVDNPAIQWLTRNGVTLPARYATGAIIGVVDLYGCAKERSSRWHEYGQFGWYVRDAFMFHRVVPYKGARSLFEVDEDVVPELRNWRVAA